MSVRFCHATGGPSNYPKERLAAKLEPPNKPGIGIKLTDDIKTRCPFVPEWRI
jgi:hypothetical protein